MEAEDSTFHLEFSLGYGGQHFLTWSLALDTDDSTFHHHFAPESKFGLGYGGPRCLGFWAWDRGLEGEISAQWQGDSHLPQLHVSCGVMDN